MEPIAGFFGDKRLSEVSAANQGMPKRGCVSQLDPKGYQVSPLEKLCL
jgi:hypothetical protein